MVETLIKEYKQKWSVIKKYQSGETSGTGWMDIKNYLDGIENSLRVLGYEKELITIDGIKKETAFDNKLSSLLEFGVMCDEANKHVCTCGLFIKANSWDDSNTYGCIVCGNRKWTTVKNSKKTWKKVKDRIEIEMSEEDSQIKLIKISEKYNIDWENEEIMLKQNDVSLVIDLNKNKIFYIKDGKESIATESQLNGFFKGIYDFDIMKHVVDFYNRIKVYWKIYDNINFYYFDYALKEIKNYLEYPSLTLINNYFEFDYLKDIDKWKSILNLNETNPEKILGVSKRVLKYIKEKKIKIDSLPDIRKFVGNHGVDNFINSCELTGSYWALDNHLSKIDYLLNRKYRLKDIKVYIERADELQAITSKRDVIQYLYDYVRMSVEMNVGFLKYPRSLKLVHDVRQRDYKVILSEEETRIFKDRYEDKDNWEYKDGNYSILLPKDPIDVTREGQDLGHCVASYVRRIVEGSTYIVFMRKLDMLDKSFITIEINDKGKVVQCRGKHNRRLTRLEKDFIQKWCNRKKLLYVE